ncbi:hypothetical protein [Streptomyces atratus]|uniref:Uncharacterized protein n=1 Tax=Streptomyces atratus TaxID=1893 RepID=A0A2Z5JDQ2_STRAR|nr:hypothetical protein [Streptomyces atratus]AXE78467.1 hypothetical protein C5746_17745 [Streptomyces atratus]
MFVVGRPADRRFGDGHGLNALVVSGHRQYVNDGTYTWEITGTPGDGSGAPLKVTGTIELTKRA